MSLILKHEQHKFEGDGFFSALSSLIPKVANFVSKFLISSGAQALRAVAKAGVNISETVKRSTINTVSILLSWKIRNIIIQNQDTSLIDANISYHEEYLKHRRQWEILPNSVTNIRGFKIVHRDIENRTSAAGAATGGISAAVKAANAKKAADAKATEERRLNLIMEKEVKGSGVGHMIGTIKEFGKRFGEETKKTVKQGLNKLVDSIDTGEVKVKHKGNGIFVKNIHTGEGLSLSKYKGGVIFGNIE
ncbi:hypothetical protein LOTGIDRAFT_164092 [Lottia gigantea]|uniref:Uncharacterized protein n=1 Tax=Lottia gigantea TaxID=225164 RepID=V4A1H6_LOTGI|nr:hypothetical protein LOTGIDRAFT_164092 [Lottia gigantea]ESO90507.1 hypothetical protein LOTGIDRAFT_164092 [Lottia gigantea]